MSELFLCHGEVVHLSNREAEALFEGWERLAQADAGRPGMATLAAYLRHTLNFNGVGCMAFGMDREELPSELAGPAESAALLAVAERTAADPTLVPHVNWSPERLDEWRGLLASMVRGLREPAVGRAEPGDTADGGV